MIILKICKHAYLVISANMEGLTYYKAYDQTFGNDNQKDDTSADKVVEYLEHVNSSLKKKKFTCITHVLHVKHTLILIEHYVK